MAVALVGTVLSNADAATGWSGVTNIDTDSEVQGTGCLGTKVSNATTNATYATTQDLSAGGSNPDYHIVMWLHCLTPTLANQSAGGFRITVTDTTSTKEYYVGGLDNRKAGWGAYVVSPRIASDVNGTPVSASITSIGGTVSTNASIMGNFNNGLWDQLTIGEGLRWTSTGGTFADFVTADEGTVNNRYGWLSTTANGSILLPQCRFYIGDGSTSTTFTDTAVLMVFEPASGVATSSTVDADFFGIIVTAAASMSLSGNSFISASNVNSKWSLNVQTSTSASSFINSTFDRAAAITLASNTTFTGMTVTNSGSITTNGTTLTNCNIVDQTAPVILSSNLNELSGCSFTHSSDTPGHAVNLGTVSSTTTMTWDCNLSSNTSGDWTGSPGTNVGGTSTDAAITVNVAASQTLTISVASGATVPTVRNTGTGQVDVVAGQTTITITVFDGTSTPAAITDLSARVYLVADANDATAGITAGDVLINALTDNQGRASFTAGLSADLPVSGWVRRATSSFGALPSGTTFFSQGLLNATMSSASNTSVSTILQPDE